jgi:Ca-activated chloride channel family protein
MYRYPHASLLLGSSLVCLLPLGCGDEGSSDPFGTEGDPLAPGVGLGGAQDFGRFREILDEGGIPGPETIDDVGFFAEHKLELPEPNCGENVCMHGMLGVMGNMISGSNCTLVMIGMNTPIDPDELERPPLNLTIVVDTSGSMAGGPIQSVRTGLEQMVSALEPEDRITLVGFSDEAEVLLEYGTVAAFDTAIGGLFAGGGTNLYDGLRTGYDLAGAHAEEGRQNRVLLLSDGLPTQGIQSTDQIVDLAESWAHEDIGLSTIGMGNEFDTDFMRELAEVGAGAFYYVEDPQAVAEVFVEEATAFLVPLAEDAHIGIEIGWGYDLRAVYGAKQAEMLGNAAWLDIPRLQIAHRESTDPDPGEGRRGGGGALVLELLPTGENPTDVGALTFEYRDVASGEIVTQDVEISSPLAPWETPTQGFFSDEHVEKAFVMLNLYIGFEMAAERAKVGADAEAVALLLALGDAVDAWLAEHPDGDIEDDLEYVWRFVENLEERHEEPLTTTPVPEPWPAD